MNLIDRTGQRFGKLVVVSLAGRNPVRWLCRCDCGSERELAPTDLRKGYGCGCGMKTRKRNMMLFAAHGESDPPTTEYRSWRHMMARCLMPTHESFPRYGGRGITVCERWRDYPSFLADMGRKPTSRHTIEREDNDGNYEPGNCKWATKAEQNRNQSDTVFVEYGGKRMCLAEAARTSGISYRTVCTRIRRGWPVEQALRLTASKRRRSRRPDAAAIGPDHVEGWR